MNENLSLHVTYAIVKKPCCSLGVIFQLLHKSQYAEIRKQNIFKEQSRNSNYFFDEISGVRCIIFLIGPRIAVLVKN